MDDNLSKNIVKFDFTESCRDHLIVKNFNFIYWSYLWVLCALCFLLWYFFWILLVGKRLQIMSYGGSDCFAYAITSWSATPTLWLFSFTIFSPRPLCKAKSWKTQNTVFGYKKWLKFESDKIFWSATPTLWLVSFTIFSQRPLCKAKSWKTQNSVFGYKKLNLIEFSDPRP